MRIMKTLIELVIVLAVGTCLIFTVALLISAVEWGSTKDGAVGKISFDHFKGLYHTNSKSWVLYSDHVAYKKADDPWKEHSFYFSFRDFWRYQAWEDKIKEREKKEKNNEVLRECIESWSKDLEEYKKKLEGEDLKEDEFHG